MHELLTSTEVAERLGKSRSQINRLAATGKLSAKKLPGRTGNYLFDPEQVAELLASRKRAS